MSKILLFLSFLSLVILAFGTAFMQNNTMFWLADSGLSYKIIIEVMATILFIQIVTHPPRHIFFRILAGLVSLLVGTWTIMTTYSGTMPLLDSLSLLASTGYWRTLTKYEGAIVGMGAAVALIFFWANLKKDKTSKHHPKD